MNKKGESTVTKEKKTVLTLNWVVNRVSRRKKRASERDRINEKRKVRETKRNNIKRFSSLKGRDAFDTQKRGKSDEFFFRAV